MRLKSTTLILAIILMLAFLVRILDLANLPFGFHVDEAKVGWNAYSILKTGRDDWGDLLSLHYNTIGDFRPTGIFYLTIPFIWFFGLSVFSVRLPTAVFGVGVVLMVFLLSRKFAGNDKSTVSKIAPFAAAIITAFSPWEVVISRATSEVMMASFFILLGIYLLIQAQIQRKLRYIIFSLLAFLPSYFLYHTSIVLVPIFILPVIYFYSFPKWRKLAKNFQISLIFLVCFYLLLSAIFAFNKDAQARLSQVSITSDPQIQEFQQKMPSEEGPNHVLATRIFENKYVIYTTTFINDYFSYFSPNFLVTPGIAQPMRYQTVNNGIITYVELILLLVGIMTIFRRKLSLLPIVLLVLAPFPASLTTEDTPNLHRALLMSPFICIIAGIGFGSIFSLKRYKFVLAGLVIILFMGNLAYYFHMYSVHNAKYPPLDLVRNDGALSLAKYLTNVKSNYDTIYVTASPDEFYPWFAFVDKPDPAIFNKQVSSRGRLPWNRKSFQYQNIIFTEVHCPSENFINHPPGKVLAVDGEGCLLPNYDNITVTEIGKIARTGTGFPYLLRTYKSTTPSANLR